MFVGALIENSIPYEYHVYESGIHGLSIAKKETGFVNKEVQSWMGLLIAWLSKRWDFQV